MNVIGNHPHRGLKSQDWKCEKFDLSRTRNQTCRKINIHRARDTDEFRDMDLSSSGDLQKKKEKRKKKKRKPKYPYESINVSFARPLILLFRRERILLHALRSSIEYPNG